MVEEGKQERKEDEKEGMLRDILTCIAGIFLDGVLYYLEH